MRCPCESCKSTDPLVVNDTDQYSTYYCDTCGYEEKVVWPTPVKKPKPKFNEPSPPRRVPPKKKRRDG